MLPTLSRAVLRAQTDRRLLELAADGHALAFETLSERHRRELWRHCRRLVDDGRAEDAVQQALLQAWTALRRGTDIAEPRAWLHRIAHNAAVDMLRRGPVRETGLSEDLAGVRDPHEDAERRALLHRTLAGVAALPDRQRAALLGTVVDGREQADLARELGVSHGALRQLVHTARAKLRAAATALTPTPLSTWLAGAVSDGAPALRVAAGVGGAGLAGTLMKAGTLAVVAGGVVGAGPSLIAPPPRPRPSAVARVRAVPRPRPTAHTATHLIALPGAPSPAARGRTARGPAAARPSDATAAPERPAAPAPDRLFFPPSRPQARIGTSPRPALSRLHAPARHTFPPPRRPHPSPNTRSQPPSHPASARPASRRPAPARPAPPRPAPSHRRQPPPPAFRPPATHRPQPGRWRVRFAHPLPPRPTRYWRPRPDPRRAPPSLNPQPARRSAPPPPRPSPYPAPAPPSTPPPTSPTGPAPAPPAP